eukprot:4404918-Prymnesium_polylepis.1
MAVPSGTLGSRSSLSRITSDTRMPGAETAGSLGSMLWSCPQAARMVGGRRTAKASGKQQQDLGERLGPKKRSHTHESHTRQLLA